MINVMESFSITDDDRAQALVFENHLQRIVVSYSSPDERERIKQAITENLKDLKDFAQSYHTHFQEKFAGLGIKYLLTFRSRSFLNFLGKNVEIAIKKNTWFRW